MNCDIYLVYFHKSWTDFVLDKYEQCVVCHATQHQKKVFSYFLDVTSEKNMIIFRYQCISIVCS